MKEIIADKTKFPIGYYYIAIKLTKYIQSDNTNPLFTQEYKLGHPAFYNTCRQTFKNNKNLFDRTTTTKE